MILPVPWRPCPRNESTILHQWWWAYHSIAVFIATFFANFGESPKGELRRIPILRTPVNSLALIHHLRTNC